MRNLPVARLKDITINAGLEILDQICVQAGDAYTSEKAYELVFPDPNSLYFVHNVVKESIPVSVKTAKGNVEAVYSIVNVYDIKKEVTAAAGKTTIEQYVRDQLANFNISDADEIADFVKGAEKFAMAEIKKLCKLFSQRIHEFYTTTHNIGVETLFMKAEFGLVGYFNLNPDGTRGASLYINEERLAYRIQQDSQVLKKAGDRSTSICNDYDSVKGTIFEPKLIAAVQPIIPTIDGFGKQMKLFANSFKEIKTKTGAIKLERVNKPHASTKGKVDKSNIAKEEEENGDEE